MISSIPYERVDATMHPALRPTRRLSFSLSDLYAATSSLLIDVWEAMRPSPRSLRTLKLSSHFETLRWWALFVTHHLPIML